MVGTEQHAVGAELGVAELQRRSPVADGIDVEPVQALPGLPQDLVDRMSCTHAEREQILAGNAQRLLRLEAAAAGRA